ncbi:MAG: hypothetical protein AAGK22_26635 [Acidobacteriota bacterium]
MKDLESTFGALGMKLGDLGEALGRVAREAAEQVADGARGAAEQFQDFAAILRPVLGEDGELTRDELLAALRDTENATPEYQQMRVRMREFLAKHGEEAFARWVRNDFTVRWTREGFRMTGETRHE